MLSCCRSDACLSPRPACPTATPRSIIEFPKGYHDICGWYAAVSSVDPSSQAQTAVVRIEKKWMMVCLNDDMQSRKTEENTLPVGVLY